MPPAGKTSNWRNKLGRSLWKWTNSLRHAQKTVSAHNRTNRLRTNRTTHTTKYNVNTELPIPDKLETTYNLTGVRGNIYSRHNTYRKAQHFPNRACNNTNNTNKQYRRYRYNRPQHKHYCRGHHTQTGWSSNHRQQVYPRKRYSTYGIYWQNSPRPNNKTHTSRTEINRHPPRR